MGEEEEGAGRNPCGRHFSDGVRESSFTSKSPHSSCSRGGRSGSEVVLVPPLLSWEPLIQFEPFARNDRPEISYPFFSCCCCWCLALFNFLSKTKTLSFFFCFFVSVFNFFLIERRKWRWIKRNEHGRLQRLELTSAVIQFVRLDRLKLLPIRPYRVVNYVNNHSTNQVELINATSNASQYSVELSLVCRHRSNK